MKRHADGKCQTCPQEDETVQHFLMACPAQSSLRRAIRDKINPLELSSMLSNTASVELIYQWIYKNRRNLIWPSITLWTLLLSLFVAFTFCCLRCCPIHHVMLRTLIKYYYYYDSNTSSSGLFLCLAWFLVLLVLLLFADYAISFRVVFILWTLFQWLKTCKNINCVFCQIRNNLNRTILKIVRWALFMVIE